MADTLKIIKLFKIKLKRRENSFLKAGLSIYRVVKCSCKHYTHVPILTFKMVLSGQSRTSLVNDRSVQDNIMGLSEKFYVLNLKNFLKT